jgi:hypothetical protein
MAKDVLHVVPQDESWGVKREGNERNSSTHGTQKEAIEAARNLAREGDDIVIHRPDGTIRDHITYTAGSNSNGTAPTPVRPQDVVSVGSRVSWPAIVAGVAVTFTVYLGLTLFALAIGVSTIDYVQNRTFATGAAIVGLVALLGALFIGGNVTTRLSTRETQSEAVVYGVILWAACFFVMLVTGLNMGGNFGQVAVAARASGVEARVVDRAEPGTAAADAQRRADEVRARGEELVSDMRPATLAWWSFGVMVLSILAAIGGAISGCGPEFGFARFFPGQPDGRAVVRPV